MKNVKSGHTKPIVCLDAGHYGKYNQSPAVKTYYEAEMNWKLHHYLGSELESYGIQVRKTRVEQGKDLSLTARGRASEGSDLFLSLHSNAVGSNVDETVDYVRVYHLYDDKGTNVDDQSKALAKLLAPVIADTMQTKQGWNISTRKSTYDTNGDGVMNDNYYGVLNGARLVGTAGLILEHSFHTNTRATKWLLEDANLKKLAKAEAAVIAEYFGMTKTEDKPAEKPVEKPKVETCTVTLPVIRFGANGNPVKVMQTLLDFHGYPCPNGGADGKFGNGTKEALKYFQAEKDLDTDAVCGPLTWAKLLNT
jgi:N-acetylmuramoyl-L-alanine amidase